MSQSLRWDLSVNVLEETAVEAAYADRWLHLREAPQQHAEAGTEAESFPHASGRTRAQSCMGGAHLADV